MFPKINPVIPVRRRDLFESAEWVYELKQMASGRSPISMEGAADSFPAAEMK